MENVRALDKVKLIWELFHDVTDPDTSLELFEKLSLPVMAAPITGTTLNMGGFSYWKRI